jgi:anti-sigma factor RsiW
MTACPKEEALSAYLDGALPREEELAVRFHLDECASCRSKVKMLLVLKDTIIRTAESHPVPAQLQEAIHARMRPAWWSFLRNLRTVRPVLALALLLVAVSVAWWWRDGGTQQEYETLARALVVDHVQYLAGSDPSEIASADPDTLATWFRERVPFPVPIPQPQNMRSLGGRLCSLLGHHGAVVFYEHHRKRLSLFTLTAEVLPSDEREALRAASRERPQCLRMAEGRALCLACSGRLVRAVVVDEPEMEEAAVKLLGSF